MFWRSVFSYHDWMQAIFSCRMMQANDRMKIERFDNGLKQHWSFDFQSRCYHRIQKAVLPYLI